MPVIKTFDRGMLENYLKTNKLHFLRDEQGGFTVNFGHKEEIGGEFSISLSIEGDSIYHILSMSRKEIPKAQWSEAIMLCNTWNKERRWPKVFLHVNNPETDITAMFVAEESINLTQGMGFHG